jgi:hypothetical protein
MQDVSERQQGDTADRVKTALVGAAAGAVGVAVLDRVDWFLWNRQDPAAKRRTEQVRPGGEPPADALVSRIEKLAGADVGEDTHRKLGVATHYAIGIAPAIAFALFRDKLPGRGVPRGLLFGLGLFLTQDEVLNTVTGLGAKPQDYPWQDHARGLAAHLAYGVATEFALRAAEEKLVRRG